MPRGMSSLSSIDVLVVSDPRLARQLRRSALCVEQVSSVNAARRRLEGRAWLRQPWAAMVIGSRMGPADRLGLAAAASNLNPAPLIVMLVAGGPMEPVRIQKGCVHLGEEAPAAIIVQTLRGRPTTALERFAAVNKLSPRETELFEFIANGEQPAAAAARLGIAEGTARSYFSRIYNKLRVEGAVQALARLLAAAKATEEPAPARPPTKPAMHRSSTAPPASARESGTYPSVRRGQNRSEPPLEGSMRRRR